MRKLLVLVFVSFAAFVSQAHAWDSENLTAEQKCLLQYTGAAGVPSPCHAAVYILNESRVVKEVEVNRKMIQYLINIFEMREQEIVALEARIAALEAAQKK